LHCLGIKSDNRLIQLNPVLLYYRAELNFSISCDPYCTSIQLNGKSPLGNHFPSLSVSFLGKRTEHYAPLAASINKVKLNPLFLTNPSAIRQAIISIRLLRNQVRKKKKKNLRKKTSYMSISIKEND
jgi:hypothetical protein